MGKEFIGLKVRDINLNTIGTVLRSSYKYASIEEPTVLELQYLIETVEENIWVSASEVKIINERDLVVGDRVVI